VRNYLNNQDFLKKLYPYHLPNTLVWLILTYMHILQTSIPFITHKTKTVRKRPKPQTLLIPYPYRLYFMIAGRVNPQVINNPIPIANVGINY